MRGEQNRYAGGRGRALILLVAFGTLVGCAQKAGPAPSPRDALRQALLSRHEAELRRDPDAVAKKLRRMARENFAFFRGSLGLYPGEPSQFRSSGVNVAQVAVMGDPHPENIGTFPLSGDAKETVVDFNDFDQAGFGSFVDDVRRLCLGIYVAGDAADVRKKHRVRLVEATVNGYLTELRALGRGEAPVALRGSSAFGGGLAEILDGPAKPFDEVVASEAAGANAGGAKANEPDRAALTTALRAGRITLVDPAPFAPSFFTVKRAAATRGGIASLFVERIRVELEGPGPGDRDDVAAELKETAHEKAPFLVRLQRELQERPDQDPLLGVVAFAGKTYRLRSLGGSHRSVSVERLSDQVKGPGWGKKDFRVFAFESGRLLARGHARAKGPSGEPGLTALLRATGDGRSLTNETVAVTTRAATRLEGNVDDLRRLLAERGPLLGWVRPK